MFLPTTQTPPLKMTIRSTILLVFCFLATTTAYLPFMSRRFPMRLPFPMHLPLRRPMPYHMGAFRGHLGMGLPAVIGGGGVHSIGGGVLGGGVVSGGINVIDGGMDVNVVGGGFGQGSSQVIYFGDGPDTPDHYMIG
ncbi:uncharacterized protein LOC124282956 [Haliotis rubra]|uniref:uncharacterized protein LOC124282956 n=1 Tax=Haliotis rubra TaxID=36100 RepID=UPI001EE51FD3|nr:uncharacterized protein LOC124282956 [Haliotis rubra]